MSPKGPVILAFGESPNDIAVLRELTSALQPKAPPVEGRRRPMVLVKGQELAKAKKNAAEIAAVVRMERSIRPIPFIIAHEDCDAVEPAHEALSRDIEARLHERGVHAVPAAPAWETEAWFFLWPEAVQAACSGWAHPGRTGAHVGRIENAKEVLRRAVRPEGSTCKRDYSESDAPTIAKAVRERGLVHKLAAKSASFELFREKLAAAIARTA